MFCIEPCACVSLVPFWEGLPLNCLKTSRNFPSIPSIDILLDSPTNSRLGLIMIYKGGRAAIIHLASTKHSSDVGTVSNSCFNIRIEYSTAFIWAQRWTSPQSNFDPIRPTRRNRTSRLVSEDEVSFMSNPYTWHTAKSLQKDGKEISAPNATRAVLSVHIVASSLQLSTCYPEELFFVLLFSGLVEETHPQIITSGGLGRTC